MPVELLAGLVRHLTRAGTRGAGISATARKMSLRSVGRSAKPHAPRRDRRDAAATADPGIRPAVTRTMDTRVSGPCQAHATQPHTKTPATDGQLIVLATGLRSASGAAENR